MAVSTPPSLVERLTNLYRNIGILLGFIAGFLVFYIFAAEHAKPPRSKGEILVFRKGRMPPNFEKKDGTDVEAQATDRPVVAEKGTDTATSGLTAGASVFHWEDLCYDIQIKGKDRRLLDKVDGWVKPGLSTALMVSLAAKSIYGRLSTDCSGRIRCRQNNPPRRSRYTRDNGCR